MVKEHPLRNRTQRKVEPLHETGMQPAIPVGLGMALVHNQQALTKFSALKCPRCEKRSGGIFMSRSG